MKKYSKSKVRENLDNYIGELSKLLKSKKEIRKFNNLNVLLNSLSEHVKYYYESDEDGKLPLVNKESG